MSSWQISGQYMETCNCELLCPCIISNMAARPTEGDCKAAVAMRIEKGSKDGVERRPIRFEADGLNRAVRAGELVDQACEGIASAGNPNEAICVDNTAHPANSRLSLAKAKRSSFHAFGIDWNDTTGTKNGHFAPFAWTG